MEYTHKCGTTRELGVGWLVGFRRAGQCFVRGQEMCRSRRGDSPSKRRRQRRRLAQFRYYSSRSLFVWLVGWLGDGSTHTHTHTTYRETMRWWPWGSRGTINHTRSSPAPFPVERCGEDDDARSNPSIHPFDNTHTVRARLAHGVLCFCFSQRRNPRLCQQHNHQKNQDDTTTTTNVQHNHTNRAHTKKRVWSCSSPR